MANANSPFGLKPVRTLGGGAVVLNEYTIASAYGTDIFTGDVVEMTGTGRNIGKAAAANVDNIGRFAGVSYDDSQGKRVFSQYWPASTVATNVKALVVDDPNVIFEVQCDTLNQADVGLLADWNVGTGSTLTGQSGLYAVASAGATTNQSLRILRLVDRADNEYGQYAKAEVVFIEHVLKGVVAGVGGI